MTRTFQKILCPITKPQSPEELNLGRVDAHKRIAPAGVKVSQLARSAARPTRTGASRAPETGVPNS